MNQPVDRTKVQLTDGSPVTDDHRDLKPNGQQKGYVVLSPEERAKGFVRPVRTAYKHVGAPAYENTLRDLTDTEKARYGDVGYVKFEPYPESKAPVLGKFWTQAQLDAIGKGCGTVTTMGLSLSETYARDPKFYGGTFCCGCGKHFPVAEFIWTDDGERVGS